MRREHAQRLGIKGVGDLARHSDSMSIAGDYEFFGREEWAKLQDAYGLSFEKSVPMDSSLMYDGLRMGEVDVIVAYSTDGRIAEYDLTVLDEPKDALPPYDAVILVSPEAADDPRLVSALAELVGGIDNDAMRRANQRVDLDDNTPRNAAAELLKIARDNAEP
jgi:osmoprotectant transport system permease protein